MGLIASGPVAVSANDEVVEGLCITAADADGITVSGYTGVVIRGCQILISGAAGSNGIQFLNADGITIEDVEVIRAQAPVGQKALPASNIGIVGESSDTVTIRRIRGRDVSSVIYLLTCPSAAVSSIEGHNMRGPFPRGQLVQFNNCDSATLSMWSCENDPNQSWPEDVISVFESDGCTVEKGLADGCNSPSGVGVMFEKCVGGTCTDVYAINQGNGCFSSSESSDVTFTRCHTKDNIADSQGRGVPLSGGLMYAAINTSSGIVLDDCKWFNRSGAGGLYYDAGQFASVDLTESDFSPRPPLRLAFPWEILPGNVDGGFLEPAEMLSASPAVMLEPVEMLSAQADFMYEPKEML